MRTLFAAVLAMAVASPILAQKNEVSILAGSTSVSSTNSDGGEVKFDNASAVGVAYSRFWSPRFSTELSYMRSSHDGSLRFGGDPLLDLGSLDLTTLAAIAQFHFLRSQTFDVYAGAGVATISTSDLKSSDLALAGIGTVSVDTSTTWIANAGAVYSLGHSIGVGIDGRYAHYRPDSTSAGAESVALKLDPVTVALALKFRF
jgi:outer membrane protein W